MINLYTVVCDDECCVPTNVQVTDQAGQVRIEVSSDNLQRPTHNTTFVVDSEPEIGLEEAQGVLMS
jgi:hypothetical protein